jgi:hypothetical protein
MESVVSYQLGVERKLTEKIEDEIDELPRASWPGPCERRRQPRDQPRQDRAHPWRELARGPRGTVENLMEILGAVQRLAGDPMRPAIEGQAVEIPKVPKSPDENGASRP